MLLKKIFFYILMLVFTLTLTELMLYAISLIYPVHPIHNISLAIPDPQLGFRPNPEYPEHDKNGFRNEKVPQKIDIVALGDSQTYGSGVARENAWPQQLQELAKLNVYNMAFGGYGPAHALMLLDEALEHRPTHIVLAFYSGNDLYDAYHLVYNLDNLEFLKSTDSLSITNIQKKNEKQLLEAKIEEIYNYKDKNQLVKILRKIKLFLFNNSKTYLLLSAAVNSFATRTIETNQQIGDFDRKLALEYPEDCMILENPQFGTIFRPRYRGTALDLEDPRIREGLNIALKAMLEIKNRAEKAGVQFLIVGIPTKELVFEREVQLANILNSPPGASYNTLIKNEKNMWAQVRKFFTEQKLDFIAALPYLRKQLDEKKLPFPASLNEHLNKTGHLAIAECVRDKINAYVSLK